MDKQNLIRKLAEALRRKEARASEQAPPSPPAGEAPASDTGQTHAPSSQTPNDPEPIGDAMAEIEVHQDDPQRWARALADASESLQRAGRMLEIQAKTQQQVTDAVSELSERVGGLAGQIDEKFSDLHDQLAKLRKAAEANDASRAAETVAGLAGGVDELDKSLSDGLGGLGNDLTALRKQTLRELAGLRRMVVLTAILAAAAVAVGAIALLAP